MENSREFNSNNTNYYNTYKNYCVEANIRKKIVKNKEKYTENEIFFLKVYAHVRLELEEKINGKFKSITELDIFVHHIVGENRLTEMQFTNEPYIDKNGKKIRDEGIGQIDNFGILKLYNTKKSQIEAIKRYFIAKDKSKFPSGIREIASTIMHELTHGCHGKQPSEVERKEQAQVFFSSMSEDYLYNQKQPTMKELENYISSTAHLMAEGYAYKYEALIRSNRN